MQELDSDEEYEPVESSFNIRNLKRNDRRKSCKAWTLDEVVALVDGMSQFGVGQWTAVKRTFFSSSRRTATDIRVIYCAWSSCSNFASFHGCFLCANLLVLGLEIISLSWSL